MVLLTENIKRELALMRRHIGILRIIMKYEPIGILRLSKLTGISDQQVRYSMRILQQCGFLGPSTKGAITNEKAKLFIKNLNKEKTKIVKMIKDV